MKKIRPLKQGWEIRGYDYAAFDPNRLFAGELTYTHRMDVELPMDVHTALMAHGHIADPAIGRGDVETLWVEKQVWVYQREVELAGEWMEADRLMLRFHGLDTLCDVYWNEKRVASYSNMLVEHTWEAKPFAVEGVNTLTLVFWPVCEKSRKEELPEGFWINYSTERAFVRKAAYSFGWDWTPRVVTMGVWRPIELVSASGATLESLKADTLALREDEAELAFSATALGQEGRDLGLRITLLEGETPVAQWSGEGLALIARLPKPKLWWTHDLGQPFLYTLRAELLENGTVQDAKTTSMGIRTLALDQGTEESPRYRMVLNGIPFFSKGANWVPVSNRLGADHTRTYQHLLSLAQEAGMNTLSLWGGGIYEDDLLYRLCDELGILVWQYMMFACGEYPDFDPAFVANVKDETEKVVARLGSHACVALWIGNVEGEMICDKIGLEREMYGTALFEQLLPQWLEKLDPHRPYIPSSPWFGETPNSMGQGDRHNWEVWFTNLPYTAYREDRTTFCSEFGLHAAPVMHTLIKHTGQKSLGVQSFAFQYLNRDQSLDRMYYYMQEHVGLPSCLEEYIDLSQLVQAEALECGSEHFRRRFPACGGALIWQLNDCCGAHSWSMIDVEGVPKASYYAAKRFFAPVAVSLAPVDAANTEIWLHNGTAEEKEITLDVEVGDFLGNRWHQESQTLRLGPVRSQKVRDLAVGGRFSPNVIIGNRPRLYYLAVAVRGSGRPAIRFFVPSKELLLPTVTLSYQPGEDTLSVGADVFARMVKIDGDVEGLWFSDNWFDLLPGTTREVRVRVLWGEPMAQRTLYVKALNGEKCFLKG